MNKRGSSIVHSQSHRCTLAVVVLLPIHPPRLFSLVLFARPLRNSYLIWETKWWRRQTLYGENQRITAKTILFLPTCFLYIFDAGFFSVYRFLFFSNFQNCGSFGSRTENIFMFWCSLLCDIFPPLSFLFTLYFPMFLTKVHPCFTVTVLLSIHLCLIKLPLRQIYHIANSAYFILSLHFWHRLTFTIKSLPMQNFYTATKQCNTQAKYSL